MAQIRLGYFKNFGANDFQKIKGLFEAKNHDYQLKLVPLYQDQVLSAFADHKIDVAITDPRNHDYHEYKVKNLVKVSLIAVLQKGNFLSGQQTVELKQLSKIPDLLVAKTEEETGELTYHRDQLKISSPFLAVDSFNEAALMAESGSGYFLMNERTAPLIKSEQLQKMFLLDHGQQLKQDYVFVSKMNTNYPDLFNAAKAILIR